MRLRFKCLSGGASYGVSKLDGLPFEAVYSYASSSNANTEDMVDWTQTVYGSTFEELRSKLQKKHPNGWMWVIE